VEALASPRLSDVSWARRQDAIEHRGHIRRADLDATAQ
jgi:hypothetical protein